MKIQGFISIALITLIALLIRLPYLLEIPYFMEFNETDIAMQIASGERFPLTNHSAYFGASFNYYIALGFFIFGFHYWVPRVLTLIIALVCIPLTYLLGKEAAASKHAGLIASLFMALSFYHIFRNSHFAWTNSTTPTLCVLTWWLFANALRSGKAVTLLLCGIAYGLALQSHILVAVLAPPMAATICIELLKGRISSWRMGLRSVAFIFVGGIIGYLNMIIYNIKVPLGSIKYGLMYPKYATGVEKGYLTALSEELILLVRLLAGLFSDGGSKLHYIAHPISILFVISVLLGGGLLFRNERSLVPMSLLAGILLIPIINKAYDFINLGRYLIFLLPLCYISCGALFWQLLLWIDARCPKDAMRIAAYSSLVMLLVIMLVYPVRQLFAYYEHALKDGENSVAFVELLDIIHAATDDKNKTLLLLDGALFSSHYLLSTMAMDGYSVSYLEPGYTPRKDLHLDYKRAESFIADCRRNFPEHRIICVLSPLNARHFVTYHPITKALGTISHYVDKIPYNAFCAFILCTKRDPEVLQGDLPLVAASEFDKLHLNTFELFAPSLRIHNLKLDFFPPNYVFAIWQQGEDNQLYYSRIINYAPSQVFDLGEIRLDKYTFKTMEPGRFALAFANRSGSEDLQLCFTTLPIEKNKKPILLQQAKMPSAYSLDIAHNHNLFTIALLEYQDELTLNIFQVDHGGIIEQWSYPLSLEKMNRKEISSLKVSINSSEWCTIGYDHRGTGFIVQYNLATQGATRKYTIDDGFSGIDCLSLEGDDIHAVMQLGGRLYYQDDLFGELSHKRQLVLSYQDIAHNPYASLESQMEFDVEVDDGGYLHIAIQSGNRWSYGVSRMSLDSPRIRLQASIYDLKRGELTISAKNPGEAIDAQLWLVHKNQTSGEVHYYPSWSTSPHSVSIQLPASLELIGQKMPFSPALLHQEGISRFTAFLSMKGSLYPLSFVEYLTVP